MSDISRDTGGRSDSTNAAAAHDSGFYDPAQHDNQIVAVFEDQAAAERARDALTQAGIPQSAIEVVGHVAGDAVPGQSRAEDRGGAKQSVGDSILGAFMSLFTPEHEHHSLAHAVERGHAMLVVTPTGDMDRHALIQALEKAGPIDFDAKLAEWRQAGYDETGAARTGGEDRRVGRREMPEGASRVRSYVADRHREPGRDREPGMGTGGDVTNATPGSTSSGMNSPRT